MFNGGNVTVMVSDFDLAVGFYTEALGLTLTMRHANEWAMVTCPGLTIGIHPASEHGPAPGTPGPLSIGFDVKDLDAAMAALKKRGVQFKGPVLEDGPVRIAMFGDPDGNPLYLCQSQPA